MTAKNMTVAEIADETGANPKTIRAYLRRNATRSDEAKGSRWGNAKEGYALTAKVTTELLAHFAPSDDDADE